MNNSNQTWLVSDSCQAQALLKYEIKQLESCLKHHLFHTQNASTDIAPVSSITKALQQAYNRYCHWMDAPHHGVQSVDISEPSFNRWQECYRHIEWLITVMTKSENREEAIKYIQSLQYQYQQLASLFASCADGIQLQRKTPTIPIILRPLLIARSPRDWLHGMIHFANHQSGINSNEFLICLCRLSSQHLEQIAHAFSQQEYIDIIHALFFYKLHPQKLFNRTLHPEKLVSLKNRLFFMYDFIETFHQALVQALKQKGLHVIQDYLVHYDDLPHGIELQISETAHELILEAIKSWRLKVSASCGKLSVKQLQDLFRAYKFWFNPSHLIDAVMLLQQNQLKQAEEMSRDIFYQHMQNLYRQLTTTECLDLYGYFSNKDSCYLMRTLSVIKKGIAVSWLPNLHREEMHAIHRVYEVLECVMTALRDELATRHIHTSPYKRDFKAKNISPGRRNREAVIRIISLYANQTVRINPRMEQLFASLEDVKPVE